MLELKELMFTLDAEFEKSDFYGGSTASVAFLHAASEGRVDAKLEIHAIHVVDLNSRLRVVFLFKIFPVFLCHSDAKGL